MYGLIPLYGIIAQSVEDAEYSAKMQVKDHIPENVEFDIFDVTVMGDPAIDNSLSVEVEVAFPKAHSREELPSNDELFPTAEGVSILAVEKLD